jgi:DNA-binding NarL/FixJ family response regulator
MTDTKPVRQGLKIIFIDDQTTMILFAKALFKRVAQVEVDFYNDPKLALKAIKEDSPDLVITDLHIKEISGLDILKTIHSQQFPKPIIFILTGDCEPDVTEGLLEAGADLVIDKTQDMQVSILNIHELWYKKWNESAKKDL